MSGYSGAAGHIPVLLVPSECFPCNEDSESALRITVPSSFFMVYGVSAVISSDVAAQFFLRFSQARISPLQTSLAATT